MGVKAYIDRGAEMADSSPVFFVLWFLSFLALRVVRRERGRMYDGVLLVLILGPLGLLLAALLPDSPEAAARRQQAIREAHRRMVTVATDGDDRGAPSQSERLGQLLGRVCRH